MENILRGQSLLRDVMERRMDGKRAGGRRRVGNLG